MRRTMRVSVISHSLVADRQRLFFKYLGMQPGIQVQLLYPNQWMGRTYPGGYPIFGDGQIFNWTFAERQVFPLLEAFKPDIIYVQEEYASRALKQASEWATRLRCKLVVFVWENLRKPPVPKVEPNLVIAGNEEAKVLHNADKILAQVGVGTEFRLAPPTWAERGADIVFAAGKHTPEKGYPLFNKLPFIKHQSDGFAPYLELPLRVYWRGKVVVTPSLDTPLWKEQFAPYCNVEALMCGCYVVTSDSAAIREWLDGHPGVMLCRQNDLAAFEEAVKYSLAKYENEGDNRDGSHRAIQRFGSHTISDDLIRAFTEIM